MPTMPLGPNHMEYFHEGFGMNLEELESPLWYSLDPSWLHGDGPQGYLRAARERAEFIAEANGWDAPEMEAWLRASLPQPVKFNFRLNDAQGAIVASATRSIQPVNPTVFSASTGHHVVTEFDVEIAQSAVLAAPRHGLLFEGSSFGVRLVPVPGKGWLAEVALSLSQLPDDDQPLDTGYTAIRGKTRLAQSFLEFGGVIPLDGENSAAIKLPGLPGGRGMSLEIQVVGKAPSGLHRAGRLVCLDLPLLALDPALDGYLEDLITSADWASSEGLFVLHAGDGELQIEEVLAAASGQAEVVYRLERLFEGRESMPVLESPGIAGLPLTFASGTAFDALVQWDVEIAQSARVADPNFSRPASGVFGRILAVAGPGGISHSEVSVRWANAAVTGSRALHLAEGQPLGGTDFSSSVLPMQRVDVDLLSQSELPLEWSGPGGETTMRQSAPSGLGMGKEVTLHYLARLRGDG